MRLTLCLALAAICAGCHDNDRPRTPGEPAAPSSALQVASAAPRTDGSTEAPAASSPAPASPGSGPSRLMSDTELGSLVSSISESTGEFPSDNFVSNETSLLDVAPVLTRNALRGRAYVGVGPEQNLTYARLMEASVVYVVDIRRQNMLELMAMRAAMESSSTRASFFSRWMGRPDVSGKLPDARAASVEDIAAAISATPADPAVSTALRDDTKALMARLGVRGESGDERGLDTVLAAFATEGMDIAYSMKGSVRKYPKLRELLSATGPGGAGTYAQSEEAYGDVRRMVLGNRIVPVVGDFSGTRALQGVAQDMSKRGLTLGVFYVSNVEQYLFEGSTYPQFVKNVKAFPRDQQSLFVRVWFDQGRAHPKQRKGHRTTSMAMSLDRFVTRWDTEPYRSFWEVATDESMVVE